MLGYVAKKHQQNDEQRLTALFIVAHARMGVGQEDGGESSTGGREEGASENRESINHNDTRCG